MIYLTGMPAINVPYKGDAPGWHTLAMLEMNAYMINEVNFTGAPHLFGDKDLFDAGPWFRSKGHKVGKVLCALPERAIAEAIYSEAVVKKRFPGWIQVSDLDIDMGKLQVYLERIVDSTEDAVLVKRWLKENINGSIS